MLVIYGAFGGTFLEGWTRSNLQFQPSMITYLAIASAMHATWHLASAPLAATNRHGPFAIAYFLLVCISLYAVTQIRDVTDAALIVVCLDVVVAIIAGILLRFTDLERA
jgi:RsiW-degrading membrane proteinase PrsW (M82 family)